MTDVPIEIRRLAHAADLPLPEAATTLSAGVDLRAAVADPVVLEPGARAVVPTGMAVALPAGWEGQVRPRSGLAVDHGVTVLNSPGTVDADYRGEIAVILINLGTAPVTVIRGMRIAQLVVARHGRAVWIDRTDDGGDWSATARGAGGFGSTGHH